MHLNTNQVNITKEISTDKRHLILVAGPCAIESEQLCIEVAGRMNDICNELGIQYIFKASFDKANRTSLTSFRGIGFEEGLAVLQKVKNQVKVATTTDIHLPGQAQPVAAVVDLLQIPAFLSRQTDLLVAAAKTGKAINIKKGQFMAPEDMQYAVQKVKDSGNPKVLLTERGTTFGYQNLVVDMRSLPIMRQYAPIIFDATHSVQKPGGAGGKSSGNREFVPYLAKAAVAVGIEGLFMETHPDPNKALSDGPNMVPLNEMKNLLTDLLEIFYVVKKV